MQNVLLPLTRPPFCLSIPHWRHHIEAVYQKLCQKLDSYHLKAEKGAFLLMKLLHTLEAFASAHTGIKNLIGRLLILSLYSSVVGSEEGRGVVKKCFQTCASLTYARLELLNTLIENSKQNKELILAVKGEERKLVQKLYRASDGISQLLTTEILWRLIMPQRKKHDGRVAAASVAFQQISDTHMHTTLVQAFLNISTSRPDFLASPSKSTKKERQKGGENYFESSLRSFLLKFNQFRPRLSASQSRRVYSFPTDKVQFGEWTAQKKESEFWIDIGVFSLTLKIPDGQNSLQHYPIYLPTRKITEVRTEEAQSEGKKLLNRVVVQFSFARHSEEYLENQPMISPEIWNMKVGGSLEMVLDMKKDDASNFVALLESRRRQEPTISLNSSTASSLSTNGILPRVATREEAQHIRSNNNAYTARQSLPGHLFQPQANFGPLSSSPNPRGASIRKSEVALGQRNVDALVEASNDDYDHVDVHQDVYRGDRRSSKDSLPPQVDNDDEELIVKFRSKMTVSSPHPASPPNSTATPPSKVNRSLNKSKTSKTSSPSKPTRKDQEAAPPAEAPSTSKGKSPLKTPPANAAKASPEKETRLTNARKRSLPRPSMTPSPMAESSHSMTTPVSEATLRDGSQTLNSGDVTLVSPDSSKMAVTPSSLLHRCYAPIPIAAEVDLDSGTMVPTVTSVKERPKPFIKQTSPPSTSNDIPSTIKKRNRREMASVAIMAQGDGINVESGAKPGENVVSVSDELPDLQPPAAKKISPLIVDKASSRLSTKDLPKESSKMNTGAEIESVPQQRVWTAVLSQALGNSQLPLPPKTKNKVSGSDDVVVTAEKAARPVALPGPPMIAKAPSRLRSPTSPSLQPISRTASLRESLVPSNKDESVPEVSVDAGISHLARRIDFGEEVGFLPPVALHANDNPEKRGRTQPQPNPPSEHHHNAKVQKNIDDLMTNLENMRLEKVRAAEARREEIRQSVTQLLASSTAHLTKLIDSSTAESLEALNDVTDRHRKVLLQFIEVATHHHASRL